MHINYHCIIIIIVYNIYLYLLVIIINHVIRYFIIITIIVITFIHTILYIPNIGYYLPTLECINLIILYYNCVLRVRDLAYNSVFSVGPIQNKSKFIN